MVTGKLKDKNSHEKTTHESKSVRGDEVNMTFNLKTKPFIDTLVC